MQIFKSLSNGLLFFVHIYFCLRCCNSLTTENCVTPPLDCPNENITFWLYTRANKDDPHQLRFADPTSIDKAPWVPNEKIKIIIHGYTGHKDFAPNPQIRPAYLECCDYNVITVDYHPVALEPCYVQAAANTELVGMCAAQLIDEMVSNHSIELSKIHVIGFSLGAHVAGFIGRYIKSGKLERISGLDPALPLFATADVSKKIDPSDAKSVDVLHTNALMKGKLEISGHADFFANGGTKQPGCKADENHTVSGCEHERAAVYFAESIISKVGFYGKKCYSWIAYMIGWCELVSSDEDVLYGEHMPPNVSGVYFFNTNSESPYARGPNKSNRSYEGDYENWI
ncbi:PREDICTED: pancreatic triacylglycerol lipase-like [Papilio polytes]|uniref:pancreatic triacylglycerol lipase-like n=1 Tax=Papilio polytes TaxID=76194 RepID=UPI000675F49D|nr:PREDICTED: pancreatic triacylglycerol lipase-like [Papilio polytes]